MIELRVASARDGFHCWRGAPDSRAYLRDKHFHQFVATVAIRVTDPNRELEFHNIREELEEALVSISPNHDFGEMSCEMIGQKILRYMPQATSVVVCEDDRHGALVARDRECACESKTGNRPTVITVCGSTRFKGETQKAIAELEEAGFAVFSVGSYMHADGIQFSDEEKAQLDELHKHKIRMSDAIYVVNVGGYIGKSTASEIKLAEGLGKQVTYREPIRPRSVVEWFTERMEEKLMRNDHKGGWEVMGPRELIARARQELDELEQAVENKKGGAAIASEAADVANFVMMLADVMQNA